MRPHLFKLLLVVFTTICLSLLTLEVKAQRKVPAGRGLAVVVDERLSAVRATPELSGKLVRRLGRGRLVAVRGFRTTPDGLVFLRVSLSSRTSGWIQQEAVASRFRKGDDQRLLKLILNSTEFELVARARIFLDHFPRSPLRPHVLLVLGDAADNISLKLTRDAGRRLAGIESFSEASLSSYYLNYSGLDRYNRQGVRFIFDSGARRFYYNGAAWRELLLKYPLAPEADLAKQRLRRVPAIPLK